MPSKATVRCVWTGLQKGDKCRECGYVLKHDYPQPPIRECLSVWRPPVKLGDWTERQLSTLGITKERYVQAKELFGLAPECNCDRRIAWLNQVSDWWERIISGAKADNKN